MKFNTKFAFTVAEMLVTLLIIGIIFAIYTPIMNSSYKQNATQTTLSDAIKNFNQALYNYTLKQSCTGNLACTDLFSTDNDHTAGEKIVAVFDASESKANNCWSGNISNPTTDLSAYSCTIDAKDVIFATQRLSNCNQPLVRAAAPAKHKLKNSCGYLYIDTNGTKGPNAFGTDVFIFVITNNAPSYLYPVGGEFWQDNINFANIGTCPTDGRACAGNFVQNRGKINWK